MRMSMAKVILEASRARTFLSALALCRSSTRLTLWCLVARTASDSPSKKPFVACSNPADHNSTRKWFKPLFLSLKRKCPRCSPHRAHHPRPSYKLDRIGSPKHRPSNEIEHVGRDMRLRRCRGGGRFGIKRKVCGGNSRRRLCGQCCEPRGQCLG